MLTDDGPSVLEYNVRFGDPETQAILVRLRTDLSEIFTAIAHGTLADISVEWTNESSACVVLASGGYPGKYESGARIHGLDIAGAHDNVEIFHAGTSRSAAGDWFTAGGRVIGVTARGEALADALGRSYRAISNIHWEGMQYRRDIGSFKPSFIRTACGSGRVISRISRGSTPSTTKKKRSSNHPSGCLRGTPAILQTSMWVIATVYREPSYKHGRRLPTGVNLLISHCQKIAPPK